MNAGIAPRSNIVLPNPESGIVIPIIAVSKALPKGRVQMPLEVREKLDLKPGTKLIVVAVEDAVELQTVEALLAKQSSRGTLKRIRTMFSKVPIESIED